MMEIWSFENMFEVNVDDIWLVNSQTRKLPRPKIQKKAINTLIGIIGKSHTRNLL
jgi:hypothetical protein